MRLRRFCRIALTAMQIAALLVCPVRGMAEREPLPSGNDVFRQTEFLPTGDLYMKMPDIRFDLLDSAQADLLFDAIKAYEPPEETLLVNRSDYFYYYEHLEPLAREIYDLMLHVARDPISEGNIAVMMTTLDPGSDEFRDAYNRSYYAVTIDHPELFWLYYAGSDLYITYSSDRRMINGRYVIFFRMKEHYADFEEKMNNFNRAAEEFLSDIDLSAAEYDIVKQVHDKLSGLVTYDLGLVGKDDADTGHSAYGALVANSSGTPHFAVCDGYTLALEYLLQQCGIPAVYVVGDAGSSLSDMGCHAWNMVGIGGEWYEVDSTWDDFKIDEAMYERFRGEPSYDIYMEIIHDPRMRELLGHYLFLISSDHMEHYVASDDEDWNYSLKDGSGIVNFSPGESYHRRWGGDLESVPDTGDPMGSVIFLAPRAGRDHRAE